MRRIIARVFGAIAALLILFLLVGVILPGNWSAEESVVIEAAPSEVFPWVSSVSRWETWTNPWPEGESTGPDEGEGATRTWSDPAFGDGSFTIVRSEPPRIVEYEVRVEGVLNWGGRLTLEPVEAGESAAANDAMPDETSTRLTWSESGDFGRNPLMGYMARRMSDSQGQELARGLEKLREMLENGAEAEAETPPVG